MKSTIEDISTVKKKLHIQIPPEEISRETAQAVTDVAKKAKIPGFRPGKAPRSVVERHYAMEIQSEVMNKLISHSFLQAVQEHKLSPVETPNISNISPLEKGVPLNFTAVVEVRPEIVLGTYDNVEVKEVDMNVGDDEVAQTLERLRDMYAHLDVADSDSLANDHTAVIDFEGFRDGQPIEGAKASDHMLAIGSGALIPGFEEQLVGMKKGETRDIPVTFPSDYNNAALAGKDARFNVTLKEIKKKILPELNDEFAKDIGSHQSMDELRSRIKEDLQARKRDENASSQREELMTKLVDIHSFDVPPSMVDHELQTMARQQATRFARQGMDMKSFDVKKFVEKNRELAVKRVKGILLLEQIAEKEKVDVSEQEVNASIASMAASMRQTVDAVRKYYESQDGGIDSLRASLVREKVLGLLLSRSRKSYNEPNTKR